MTAVAYHSIYVLHLKGRINGLEDQAAILIEENAALKGSNEAFKALAEKQSAAIDDMFRAGQEREQRLADALALPPRVIYRDKIVEVPSIVSGPCEQVVVDIALYVDGVMR